ncbi:hypothetical protein BCR34DRAFT_580195 [Clohesyomyces aquaticus]|uniref:Uncharacterized protein n=1 Tax=Clohesyomyces aquaticus TaxID=1231657 RepID=A0A1Y1Y7W6_9PLEO|nr:hypothetical protein BCR34DRAFT_580195 [Clohesyomyces aquaticus]
MSIACLCAAFPPSWAYIEWEMYTYSRFSIGLSSRSLSSMFHSRLCSARTCLPGFLRPTILSDCRLRIPAFSFRGPELPRYSVLV